MRIADYLNTRPLTTVNCWWTTLLKWHTQLYIKMTILAPHLKEYFQPRFNNIWETKNASYNVGISIPYKVSRNNLLGESLMIFVSWFKTNLYCVIFYHLIKNTSFHFLNFAFKYSNSANNIWIFDNRSNIRIFGTALLFIDEVKSRLFSMKARSPPTHGVR
jgi:hypothetical protein